MRPKNRKSCRSSDERINENYVHPSLKNLRKGTWSIAAGSYFAVFLTPQDTFLSSQSLATG